ncbi:MAG: SPASM domain-containing protein [Deltaproteobacteria bacterium]|nr:SPASM domain-containing protein [Deltaproteobacteria bacterium]
MTEASLGCVLSPYLRPVVEDGRLALDHAVAGTVHRLSPLQESIVRMLWDPSAMSGLDALVAREGTDAVADALAGLLGDGVLFPDLEQCEAWIDSKLVQGCPSVPFVDQIELTNTCPMRCQFCPRGVAGRMKRPTGFMDLELYKKLLGQLNPTQSRYRPLELHHLGESLLHPQVVAFVQEASARGIPSEMSVNPSLLTPSLARGLIQGGLQRLVLSLDGMDDETLVGLRGPAARYSLAERNIDALLEQVARAPKPPTVVIQMLDLQRNRRQQPAFLARWAATGLPTVHAYVKDLDGPDPDSAQASGRPTRYLCTYPWRSVVVLWDGRVVPCCRDADGDCVIGDLHQQSLEQLWHDKPVRSLRAALASRTFPQGHPCLHCGWRRDQFAAAMQERHPDHAAPNPLRW